MEKISGQKLPRDNKAGKRSFVRVAQTDFMPSRTEVQCAEIVDGLVARANVMRVEFSALALNPSRSNASRARDILDEFNEIRDELRAFHRVITPIY